MEIANSQHLPDYIIRFEGLLSQHTCEEIVEWAKSEPEADTAWDGWEWAKSAVTNTENQLLPSRTCEHTMLNENRGPCWPNIQQALAHIIEHYPYHHKATQHTGVSLIRYGVGHRFEEHIDHYGGANRTLSSSIVLNQDYEGGALRFWQGQYPVPDLNTGDAVVFPSNFCYPHEVQPVTAGTRYVLITWFQ
jgi:predicted 2-oxoglutarate/Fe(II)-dependent dioxygenase YbiX